MKQIYSIIVKLTVIMFMLINSSFANEERERVFPLSGVYNGYNILLVYDSVDSNCEQYGARFATNDKVAFKSMKDYKINDKFVLIAECNTNNKLNQFILDRTHSVKNNKNISRFHIYTIDDYTNMQKVENDTKQKNEFFMTMAFVMAPLAMFIGICIISGLPL